ncbi:MAG: 3-deoxy-7-phosphoheptulonate synthase [Verrucomicrobia bacterium]|nr:3-deoxy-7-phosphoheptulonate synthase [Verrucomicrobiota bacterium]MCH8512910.1 3-deoxy-7-phosphoheptulonate synthase [Kiritimatiellia bacterium]
MIIVLKLNPSPGDIRTVEDHVRDLGYVPHTLNGEVRTVIACIGDETSHADLHVLLNLPMVTEVIPIQKKFKLISREVHPDPMPVMVGDLRITADTFHVIAGPCAVESMEQTLSTARSVKSAGATLLRGGAYKPRTSPYDFQGLGREGLKILAEVKAETGLPVVTELVSERDAEAVAEVADVIQIGARNALNYALLTEAAQTGRPVLLKRGLSSTMQEWLLAAEYIAKQGNPNIILCERGIRTYETATRNTLDLSAVAAVKRETGLPVFVDPSHAAGRLDLVLPLARAAVAVGADGLLVEVHPDPEHALSDQAQQMTFDVFRDFIDGIRPYVQLTGRDHAF